MFLLNAVIASSYLAVATISTPKTPELDLAIHRKASAFEITASNRGKNPMAFYKYSWAWELSLFTSDGKQLTNEKAYLSGGIQGSVEFFPPHLIPPSRYDWVVLMPGESIVFGKGAYTLAGRLTKFEGIKRASLSYVGQEPRSIVPSWIDLQVVDMMPLVKTNRQRI